MYSEEISVLQYKYDQSTICFVVYSINNMCSYHTYRWMSGVSFVYSPYTWAACLRFIYNSSI